MTADGFGAEVSGAVAVLRARIRAELGLVDDTGGAIDIERVLRTSGEPGTLEEQAGRVLADAARFRAFISDLTVGETHFLRHPLQLARLTAILAPALARGEPQRVWCAGCSSGEEPLSVALLVLEGSGPAALGRLDVLGTDVSERAIARGRTARYSPWSFRGCPPWLWRHFARTAEGIELSNDVVRRCVSLETAELVARARRFEPRSLDAILFRNVAIYLDEEHLRAFYAAVAVALKPGAPLVVGPADPRPGAGFCVDASDPDRCIFVVGEQAPRRDASGRGEGAARAAAPRVALWQRPRAAAVAPPARRAPPPAPARFAPPALPAPAAGLPGEPGRQAPPTLGRARALADAGFADEARAALLPLVPTMDGPPARWWVPALTLLGQLELEGGRAEAAVDLLRRAVFLAPTSPTPRFWYGMALQRVGRAEAMLAQLREAARLLEEAGATAGRDRDTDDDDDDELRSAVESALEAWR